MIKKLVRAASGVVRKVQLSSAMLSGVVMLAASGGQGQQLTCQRDGTYDLAAGLSGIHCCLTEEAGEALI